MTVDCDGTEHAAEYLKCFIVVTIDDAILYGIGNQLLP